MVFSVFPLISPNKNVYPFEGFSSHYYTTYVTTYVEYFNEREQNQTRNTLSQAGFRSVSSVYYLILVANILRDFRRDL